MSQFFCAQMSRESGEDIIGSAPDHLMYVLIECPYPWAANEFDSKAVPPNLKAFVDDLKQAKFPIRFLLFVGERHAPTRTRVMIFRKPQGLSRGYHKREFEVGTIEQVAPLLQQYLTNKGLDIDCQETTTQDIFVCTHGSHDKCCAKFGHPFYRQALATINQLQIHTQIWQVSHIGGHRFAPTIVTFPDGRYYGALDNAAFTAIMQRTGDIQYLQQVYRGWGVLPNQVQVVEREIALHQGWKWFEYQVVYKILNTDQKIYPMHIELQGKKLGEQTLIYTATVIEGETSHLISSCSHDRPSKLTQLVVKNLRLHTEPQPSYWTCSPRRQGGCLRVSSQSQPTPHS
ncbi:sucrase ferredoxin [Phormidesmis sp. 146-35]